MRGARLIGIGPVALALALAPAPGTPAVKRTTSAWTRAVDRIVNQPSFAPASWGIEVRDLATGQALYERNPRKNMMPASMAKLFTTAAALDALGPEARVRTTLETAAPVDASGRLAGDLYVVGRGDPGLAKRGEDGRDGLDALVDGLLAAGVRQVEGRLLGEDGAFAGERRGPYWEWGDLVWCYGAEVSGLSWNGSCADLVVTPGPEVGAAVAVARRPASSYYDVVSTATTSVASQKADLRLVRELGSSLIQLSGTYPSGADPDVLSVALEDPARYAATILAERLAARGVRVAGGVGSGGRPAAARVLALHESEPLSQILKETNKPSDNLRAESLLRLLGLQAKGEGSVERGLEALGEFLKRVGVDADTASMDDGSGLAVTDLVSPHQVVDLLAAMDRHPHARFFEDSLPVAGVDGTLEHRMRGTAAKGRVKAKTGTRRHVSSLGGYVSSASGRRLAFSIMVNNHTVAGREATAAIDAICEILARQ
jgi:D-alanyl-D-alanine carboxypeptidase/D-alanyl-D-alanine-endopeptidase (penicillin-binding protein 4)